MKNHIVLAALILLIAAPTAAQDSLADCEELREISEKMDEAMEDADTTEERREIAAEYSWDVQETRRECLENSNTQDSSENDQNTQKIEISQEQRQMIRKRLAERRDKFEEKVEEELPERCTGRAEKIHENYLDNITEIKTLDEVEELHNRFSKKLNGLENSCQKDSRNGTETEAGNSFIPESGQRITEEQVNKLRQEYSSMQQNIQNQSQKIRKQRQQIQDLQDRIDELKDETEKTPETAQKNTSAAETAGDDQKDPAQEEEKSRAQEEKDQKQEQDARRRPGDSRPDKQGRGLIDQAARMLFG